MNELFVDAGVTMCEALPHNSVLKSIDLQQAQIGPPGAKALASYLRDNTNLMNLKLHYNHLGPVGVAYIAEALKSNRKLTNLDLGDNGIMQAADDRPHRSKGIDATARRHD